MSEQNDAVWEKLAQHSEKLGAKMRGRVNQRYWAKFDMSCFGDSIVVDAMKKRDQFRGATDAEFYGWLRTIARRKLVEKWRHWSPKKRDLRRERSLNQPPDGSSSPGYDPADSFITASLIVSRKEQARFVDQALAALPEKYVEALALHYEMGLTRHEVAEWLEITEGQASNRLRQGLKELRKQLAAIESEFHDCS